MKPIRLPYSGRLVYSGLVLAVVACPAAAGASAQTPPETPPDTQSRRAPDGTSDVAALADSLLVHGGAAEALDVLDAALADKGPVSELSWRAARVAVNLGMVIEPDDEDAARDRYTAAEAYAERRIAADSADARAWEWLGVARGRRSLTEGLRTRATLSNGIRDAATRALALDSLRPGGHHVLGMWHAEIRRLNVFERIGAGALGAHDVGEASWNEAVRHLEAATRIAPEGLVHRVELAKVYLDVDRNDEAARELRRVLALDPREPGDARLHAEAEELLARMEGGVTPRPLGVNDREAASPPN